MSDCPLKLSKFLRNLHCFCACCGGTIQDITDGSPKEEEEEEEGRESKTEQGTTPACFSKETVLQPKRTRKLWRSDKASKGNPGEISESPIKEKATGEEERGGKVVRRSGSLHPAQVSEKEVSHESPEQI